LLKRKIGKPVSNRLSVIRTYHRLSNLSHVTYTMQATPMPMYCTVVSAVARRFLAIPASSATCEHPFRRLVGYRLASFTSAAPIHGQLCISEWK